MILNLKYSLFLVLLLLTISFQNSNAQEQNKFSDLYFEYEFAVMAKKTPIHLEYNNLVGKCIDKYLNKKQSDISRFLSFSKLYFPIFEEYLAKYNLPLELKYLPIVESGLDPTAVSSSGAVGLWQFLYNSSKMFDLEITSYIDERRDVYKATDAACRYLRYLYQTFNDWQLVLASYNGGPGVIRNARERSGKDGLWNLLPYLPEQTQNYVPAFFAMNYVMTHAAVHQISPSDTIISYEHIDTIEINYEVKFEQISSILGISMELLRFLNPVYKLDLIPETGKPHTLILPTVYISKYLQAINKIIGGDSLSLIQIEKNKKLYYTVEKGDFLHKIAIKYNCSPQDIKKWNNMTSDYIAPGQVLLIKVTSNQNGSEQINN
jgi:membrane-bound lytic murein transglycosylase D